eukprot:gene35258-26658_t
MANASFGRAHVDDIRALNAAAIDVDGWLHTGAVGAIDAAGVLRVTGSLRDAVVLCTGERAAPAEWEAAVRAGAGGGGLVDRVVVVGDGRPHCVALVALRAKDGGELTGSAAAAVARGGGAAATVAAAMSDDAYPNACPSAAAAVRAFTIVPHDLPATDGRPAARRAAAAAAHAAMVGWPDGGLYRCTHSELADPGGTGCGYGRYEGGGAAEPAGDGDGDGAGMWWRVRGAVWGVSPGTCAAAAARAGAVAVAVIAAERAAL